MVAKNMVEAFLIVAASVLSAGLFYGGWLAVFIPGFKSGIPALKIAGWLSAPVVTAVGFATGIVLAERVARRRTDGFLRVLVWPLAGCVVGAGAIFWFGPMLIVFGMFVAGTAAVALREFQCRTKIPV